MKTILTALILIATPAHAEVAIWKETTNWRVSGDVENAWCGAVTSYTDGTSIHVSRNNGGWNFSIAGIRAVQGQTYAVKVATKFSVGTLTGTSVINDQVVFANINATTLANLIAAPSIYIEGIGVYNITGSSQAIADTQDCFNAITAAGVSGKNEVSW